MRDESVRAWMDQLMVLTPDGAVPAGDLTRPPAQVSCRSCGQALALRFWFERVPAGVTIADREWALSDGRWTRAWERAARGLPARHQGYQKRQAAFWTSDHPDIQTMPGDAVMVCVCGTEQGLSG